MIGSEQIHARKIAQHSSLFTINCPLPSCYCLELEKLVETKGMRHAAEKERDTVTERDFLSLSVGRERPVEETLFGLPVIMVSC